jgi:hypothetical protein
MAGASSRVDGSEPRELFRSTDQIIGNDERKFAAELPRYDQLDGIAMYLFAEATDLGFAISPGHSATTIIIDTCL